MIVGHLPSLPTFSEEALKEARELKTPDMGGGSSVGDPFWDCFTGVDEASEISDASLLLEEAQRFISRAISRFRVDLSQREVELQKVSGERDALRLLCSQKNEAIKDLQADLAKAWEEEAELDKQAKRIEELETWLAEAKAEVESSIVMADKSIAVYCANAEAAQMEAKRIEELETRLAEAKAEVESSIVMADKSIVVYCANAEAAQMEAREAADIVDTRAHWIKRVKELEAEALASDGDDDDDDEGSKSGSEYGGEPGGEEIALNDNPEA
ncbi:uncharacterized protein [Nicotiana tomentosiformis]|uniref:uncharacterized protein n=1 Tax=Nicotiana tomentosiformis TaxID=4098 RepID=UPI00388CAE96